jgi:hypothetical protein
MYLYVYILHTYMYIYVIVHFELVDAANRLINETVRLDGMYICVYISVHFVYDMCI